MKKYKDYQKKTIALMEKKGLDPEEAVCLHSSVLPTVMNMLDDMAEAIEKLQCCPMPIGLHAPDCKVRERILKELSEEK